MTRGTYGPRVAVHPDRYGAVKSGPNLWAVLHTSEGGESDNAAENLASFLGRPGDRPNGRGGVYGSSYHAIFDTDRILPAVPYGIVAYSAGGGNAQGIHACFPGKANQTREQWLDPVSRAMIRQCATWLVDVAMEFGIPVHYKMTSSQMRNKERGLGDHYTVTAAFGKSTHTDVGPNFPWDILFSEINAVLTPKPLPPPKPPGVIVTTTKSVWQQARVADVTFGPGDRLVRIPQAVGYKAATINLHVVTPNHDGFITAFLGPPPDVSTVNYSTGIVSDATTTVPVDAEGWFALNSTGYVRVLVDLVGVHS